MILQNTHEAMLVYDRLNYTIDGTPKVAGKIAILVSKILAVTELWNPGKDIAGIIISGYTSNSGTVGVKASYETVMKEWEHALRENENA